MDLPSGKYWDVSWSPIRGCSHASPGCDHCWAERMAKRFCHGPEVDGGLVNIREVEPFHGFATSAGWTGRVELIESELKKPLHWRKPRVVALNWMGDLFHPSVPASDIQGVFGVIEAANWHKYIILTKRPERLIPVLYGQEGNYYYGGGDYLKHVIIGVSAEDQETANKRITELRKFKAEGCGGWTVAASLEPLLEPVDLPFEWLTPQCPECSTHIKRGWNECTEPDCDGKPLVGGIDWVICGGESGPGARPMYPDWVRSIRDQCQAAGVPFFLKGWGNRPPGYPTHFASKKFSGRLLDGRTWDELPKWLVTPREQ